MMTREEFLKAFWRHLKALGKARGISEEELEKALTPSTPNPERKQAAREFIRCLGMAACRVRTAKGLTMLQVAQRSELPLEFVQELEANEIGNPDTYLIYRLSIGLGMHQAELYGLAEELQATLQKRRHH